MQIPSDVQAAFDAYYEELASYALPTDKARELVRKAQEMAGANWDELRFEMLDSASSRIQNHKERLNAER